ncbi:MAG: hypothetical protein JSS69_14150 [Acidobacteria bacterium]|nr:hypothetical protein [Acidobacteriota bacterium]MBS1867052.1 hypothetical protein [Acidobacteriota bacterium]
MKFIPTGSQTVGPFFSIGLDTLCQQPAMSPSPDAVLVQGTIFDGENAPIPDAVFEFWSDNEFVRAATNEDGNFFAVLKQPVNSLYFDVLIFMRGLMRPVLTRVYLGDERTFKEETSLQRVPPERRNTLCARAGETKNHFSWDVHMQGDRETVFFEF